MNSSFPSRTNILKQKLIMKKGCKLFYESIHCFCPKGCLTDTAPDF